MSVRVDLKFQYDSLGAGTPNVEMPEVPEIGSSLIWDGIRYRVDSVTWEYRQPSDWDITVFLKEGVRVRTGGSW